MILQWLPPSHSLLLQGKCNAVHVNLRKLIISLQTVWLLSSIIGKRKEFLLREQTVDKRNGKRMQKGKK